MSASADGHQDYPKVERHIATPEELAEHRDFVARSRRLKLEMRSELLEKYPAGAGYFEPVRYGVQLSAE